jgi:hypothetical protein
VRITSRLGLLTAILNQVSGVRWLQGRPGCGGKRKMDTRVLGYYDMYTRKYLSTVWWNILMIESARSPETSVIFRYTSRHGVMSQNTTSNIVRKSININDFWDLTSCILVYIYILCGGYPPTEATRFYETRRHIPKELRRQQHLCKTLSSGTFLCDLTATMYD